MTNELSSIGFVCPDEPKNGIHMSTMMIIDGLSQLRDIDVRHIASVNDDFHNCQILHFQIGAAKSHRFVWQLFETLCRNPARPLLVATIHESTLHDIAISSKNRTFALLQKKLLIELSHHFNINIPLRFLAKHADMC
ncbi:MAG: hypothetical protein R3A44_05860 [Caldilineaceae bacterium]